MVSSPKMIVRAAAAALVLSLGVTTAPAQAALLPGPTITRVWTTHNQAGVEWSAVTGAQYYKVNYSTSPDFAGGVAKFTTSRNIVLSSLQASTTYNLRVLAINANKVVISEWSTPVKQFKTKAPPVTLQVGTYNVKNPNSSGGYAWKYRKQWIAEGIRAERVGVVGLQELYQKAGREELLAWVNKLAGPDTYAMTQDADDGDGYDNRIMYDTRLFTRINGAGEIYPADRQDPGEDTKRWWNWAIFEHKRSGKQFVFANTHLSPNNDAVDVKQWIYLAYRVRSIAGTLPVIIVGDFNSTKFEAPSKDMLKTMYRLGFGDVLGQTYRSYATYQPRAQNKIDAWIGSSNRGNRDMRTFSVTRDKNSNSIDWIFASNHLKVPRYRVYAKYTYPYLHQFLPSDHQLVTAQITLP